MISKCTIIIATFNRPYYLKRILSYYDKHGRDFNIIVADSSSNENKEINKKNISLFSNLDIQYIDKYSSKIEPFYKWSGALNYINTKYSVLCADDDFITPNSINKSIEFLENNLDYTCVHGNYISFSIKYDKRGNGKFFWCPLYRIFNSVIFTNPEERLLYQFLNFMHTIYSVHRTNFFKMIFNETIKYTDDGRFSELLLSMLDLIYGKMKKLDLLYSAREATIDSAGRTSKNLKDFMRVGTYEKKYIKFKNCIAKHLAKKSQLSIDESKKVIDEAMSTYFKKPYSKSFKRILIGKMINLLNALDLPESIDKNIRMLYKKIFTPEINDLKNTIESPNSKYFDDFNKIRYHVLLYAKLLPK